MAEEQATPEKETPPKGMAKADLGKRAIALIVDGVIAGIIALIPIIGSLIGAAYMLLRDGLKYEFMDQRSLGKKLMKLRPVPVDGGTVDINTSIRRNWMFALGALTPIFLFIPILGWLLIIAAAIINIIEIILVLSDEEGRRWGDKLANTKVVEVEN